MRVNSIDQLRLVGLALICMSGLGFGSAAAAGQTLARVGDVGITEAQLESAIRSAPFATAFPAMDEDRQAALRGDMLIRLVDAELLRQEALGQGIDKRPEFADEITSYRGSLLYRRYMNRLRDSIGVPSATDRELKQKYRDDPDALAAARASYAAGAYRRSKQERFDALRKRYHYRAYPQRMAGAEDDTVIAEADRFAIRLADLSQGGGGAAAQDNEEIRLARLDELAEMQLAARAAADQGLDVSREVEDYRQLLLVQALLNAKEREWIPDRAALADYFAKHPELGQVPELRHVAQIVLASREEAEALRRRILQGESLFDLASRLSIDPVGRAQAGDLGWLPAGSGYPRIEGALDGLADDVLSEVIETPKGFHLVMIIDRKPAIQMSLDQIEDRVRQALVSEKKAEYLKGLRQKYPVRWLIPDRAGP